MSRRPASGWGPRPPRPPAAPPSPPSPPDPPGGLSALLSQADHLLSEAAHSVNCQSTPQQASPSLDELLARLHAQESVRDTRSTHLNLASNLLSRLNASNPLTKLVVTLYPGDEGYTLSLSTQQHETELVRFSYEDTHVLDSVDSEELPVIVMDLLAEVEHDTQDLFHSGCVVCELRDLRKGPRGTKDLVLLRPTTQSIICDSIAMTRGAAHAKWTSEDRNNLESQVVLATEGPLCLDPNPVVSLIAAKAHHSRTKFSTVPLRRHATKRYSQAGQNRKRKLESLAAPPELALHDFIRTLNTSSVSAAGSGAPPGKRKQTPVEALRAHQDSSLAAARVAEANQPQPWTHGCLSLASPELRLALPAQVDVQKFVRPIAKRPETSDMTPQLVEEYVLETAERGQARVYHTRLTILQRLANDEYIGELYVERDFREEDRKGSTCRFLLGTRTNALRYINQFTEIFTEEGRKNVKITHKVPNQQPRVTFTAGMRQTMAAQASSSTPSSSASPAPGTSQAQPQPQAAILQKKTQPTPQQLQVSSMSTPASSPAKVTMVSSGLPASGTITVSSSSLGQVALQIQPPAKLGSGGQIQQIIQTSQGHQIVQQRVAGQVVQTLQPGQIVQQVNSAGQVVHTLQAGQVVQMQQQQAGQAAQIVPHAAAQIVQQPSGQLIQQPIGQLTALVPTSIASKLPTAPLARPDLPSSLSQPVPPPATPGNTPGKGENQQEAISAIVQSLMRAETQFEQKKKLEEQRKSLPSPGGVPISPGSVPQLPTVPVPQASLHGAVAQSKAMGRVSLSGLLSGGSSQHQLVSSSGQQQLTVSMAHQQQQHVTVSSSGQQQLVYVNSLAGQQQQQQLVTVSSMTTAQHQQLVAAAQQQLVTVSSMTGGQQQQQMVMVSSNSGQATHMVTVSATQMSQLAAQLARPVQASSSLPTYSQALRDSQSAEGRSSSLQTSPRRRPSEAPSPHTQLLPSPAGQPLPSPSESSVTGLSALLADTPAADKPLPPGAAGVSNSNSNSLLERLVSGSHLGTSHSTHPQQTNSSSNLTPAASQLPSIHTQHHNSSSNVSTNGSSEEITLQSLLSHPSKVPPNQSPTKHSPLLQQLQQPVQSGHQARIYTPQPGLTSPRQLPPSPRANVTSPRPAQSPRHSLPPSPRPTSALQQQLMQPPAPRYPTATSQHSILSAHLTAPPRSTPHSPLLTGLVVTQPHHTTSNQQVVSVSLSDLQSSMTTTSSVANGAVGQVVHAQQLNMVPGQVQQVQLVNQGAGQHQVQLVSQAGGQHQVQLVNQGTSGQHQVQLVNQAGMGQHQVQLVNQGSGHQVQLVNQGSGQHQVQLVNQGSSGQHQVQLVNQSGSGQVQLVNQSQSGQMQLVNQVAGQGGQQIMVNNVPMQLSISHPVSFSVNLSEAQTSSLANGVTQTPILVSGAGKTGVTVTSMGNLSNLGKLVSNGPNGAPTTVLLQQQGGNILLPQQQQFASIKQGSVVRQQQVMVRPGQQSPVLVQLPSGQQIVRQVSINPNMNCNLVNQSVNKTVVASPSPSGPSTPGVPPSVTSPQATHTPDSPMVVQLNHQGDPVAHHSGPHFLLANQKAGLVNQPMGGQIMTGAINQAALNNQPHLKIRQQRKQSLK